MMAALFTSNLNFRYVEKSKEIEIFLLRYIFYQMTNFHANNLNENKLTYRFSKKNKLSNLNSYIVCYIGILECYIGI